MSGNLVHPRSWVTWQVRAEIRLTRKTLLKKEGGWAAETKQTGGERRVTADIVCVSADQFKNVFNTVFVLK